MKIEINFYLFVTGIFFILLQISCGKEFLNQKRDRSQVTPDSLEDLRAILYDDGTMNYNFPVQLGVIGGDEYYISSPEWSALTEPTDKNGYIWADEIYEGRTGYDWNRGYEKVMVANFVFDEVQKIPETPANKSLRDEILGEGHFFRGMSLFFLTQLFCEQYTSQTAKQALGLPLRTTSNINVHFSRSSLEDTYKFILEDISAAILLLPERTKAHTRPGKAAALALMATVYMQMENHRVAISYAEKALAIYDELINYNLLDTNASEPFPLYGVDNPEILFYATTATTSILSDYRMSIDSGLYNSYHKYDLRKKIFFAQDGDRIIPKGGYAGINVFLFTGITTGELYLIAAECQVKASSDTKSAVSLLNKLQLNRYQADYFQPISNDITTDELLVMIADERRKELVLRGRRWQDLRRYIVEDRFDKPLVRIIDGIAYTLKQDSKKWVWPIPPDVISLGRIQQNVR